MFHLTPEVITAIVAIENTPEASHHWLSFLKWLKSLKEESIDEFIHSFPPKDDVNYSHRLDMQRGVTAALDVLYGILSNPEDALESAKIIDKMSKEAAKRKE